MPYDDDDDLFEEFDFVDDDDDAPAEGEKEAEAAPKPKKRPNGRDKAEKPPGRGPKRARPAAGQGKREPRREPAEPKSAPPATPIEPAPVGYIMDDEPLDEEPSETEPEPARVPAGPPADHAVHVYEYGEFKRTIPRKFTEEEAVSFAEEYTRTGKPYGRYALATPEDEEPAPTFTAAGKS
jgi:hypothetical protein